jgi:L-lactate dehydrogenase complex protein LldG
VSTLDTQTARSRILERLRKAPQQARALPAHDDYYRNRPAYGAQEKVDRFTAAMRSYHAEVIPTTQAALASAVKALLQQKQIRHLACGTAVSEHAPSLYAALCEQTQVHVYDEAIEQLKHLLFTDIDAGLTFCRSGIAETGSLILWPTPQEPRLLSLVPAIHIAILDATTLHDDLYQAMHSEGWAKGMPTNALLISGPSKTADIQQTLAYGAHGPKELIIFLLEAEGDTL